MAQVGSPICSLPGSHQRDTSPVSSSLGLPAKPENIFDFATPELSLQFIDRTRETQEAFLWLSEHLSVPTTGIGEIISDSSNVQNHAPGLKDCIGSRQEHWNKSQESWARGRMAPFRNTVSEQKQGESLAARWVFIKCSPTNAVTAGPVFPKPVQGGRWPAQILLSLSRFPVQHPSPPPLKPWINPPPPSPPKFAVVC